ARSQDRRKRKPLAGGRRARIEPLDQRLLLTGVTYQGGPLTDRVAVDTVFLGTAWTSDPSLKEDAARLDQFFTAVTNGSYLDMLAQYSTAQGGPIGRGSLAGSWNLPQNDWTASVIDDQTVRDLLGSEIAANVLPPPDGNQLLFVFTPPNVVVTQGGQASNGTPVGFAGQAVYYAVIPDPIGNDRARGLSVDDQQTMAASHELAEAITDPTFTSWWDDGGDANTGKEIADFANPATDTVYLGQYAVERVWSNQLGGLETPAGATLAPTAGTAPPSSTGSGEQALPIPPNLGIVAQEITGVSGYDGALIADAYKRFLGRSPDTGGMHYWLGQMQSGMSANAVDAALLASDEYVQRHGASDLGWLSGVYRDLLDRPPDAAGLQYWSGELQAGVGKPAVALAIATSFEHEALVVGQDFQTLLGQSPGTVLNDYWAGQLQRGPNDAGLVASLIGSA
ncbi:MAG TPA: DUF4214 domain-containing protein, partial [Pirellulales bacterium]|nr:DUF4214 domain-containing protein [Pirellulales bacterium]